MNLWKVSIAVSLNCEPNWFYGQITLTFAFETTVRETKLTSVSGGNRARTGREQGGTKGLTMVNFILLFLSFAHHFLYLIRNNKARQNIFSSEKETTNFLYCVWQDLFSNTKSFSTFHLEFLTFQNGHVSKSSVFFSFHFLGTF